MRLQLAMTLAGIRHAAGLAQEIGVRAQTVNKWLHREDIHIDSYILFKAAKRLRVSPHWLLLGQGAISQPPQLSHTHTRLLQRFDALPQEAQAALLAQLACDSVLAQSTT